MFIEFESSLTIIAFWLSCIKLWIAADKVVERKANKKKDIRYVKMQTVLNTTVHYWKGLLNKLLAKTYL